MGRIVIVLIIEPSEGQAETATAILQTVRSGMVSPHLLSDDQVADEFHGPFGVHGADTFILEAIAAYATGDIALNPAEPVCQLYEAVLAAIRPIAQQAIDSRGRP